MDTLDQWVEIEQIRTLRIRYSHCYDSQDIDGLCELFTEDAVCVFDPRHGGNWVGLPQIRKKYLEWFAKYPGYFVVLHAVTNHDVTLLGPNMAKGRAFLLDYNFTKGENSAPLGTIGVYDDRYVKTEHGWKFQKVSLDFLWPERWISEPSEPIEVSNIKA